MPHHGACKGDQRHAQDHRQKPSGQRVGLTFKWCFVGQGTGCKLSNLSGNRVFCHAAGGNGQHAGSIHAPCQHFVAGCRVVGNAFSAEGARIQR